MAAKVATSGQMLLARFHRLRGKRPPGSQGRRRGVHGGQQEDKPSNGTNNDQEFCKGGEQGEKSLFVEETQQNPLSQERALKTHLER